MFYPTVTCEESNLVHVVKNKHICICGFTYNELQSYTRNDRKKIKFSPDLRLLVVNANSVLSEFNITPLF